MVWTKSPGRATSVKGRLTTDADVLDAHFDYAPKYVETFDGEQDTGGSRQA